MTHARTRRNVSANLRVKGHQPYAVLLPEHQVRETRRQSHGVLVFGHGPAAVIHGSAEIQQQRRTEVRLLFVLTNVETVRSSEDTPVDVPDLVSRHVLPVLLELDTEALV